MEINSVIFSEGNDYFQELSQKYITHDKGLFILAPSGTGKTYFCQGQSESHWIDGDYLWETSGAHPKASWWLGGEDLIHRIDQRSDVVTMEAKLQGFWIMGASNFWLKPDAIVIPEWNTHVSYIKEREEYHYDGGAKTDALEQVKNHIAEIEKWHTDYDVPSFQSIQEAVQFLTNSSI